MKNIDELIQRAPLSFYEAMGGEGIISDLEEKLKQFLGCRFIILVPSATFALFISLKALGVKSGDEVIVSAYDWFAASAAVLHCNAIPIFADVDEWTYTINPQKIDELVSERTKAVIVTHLFGHPADMPSIMKIAKKRKIYVIEDCAQALGAVCNEKRVGSWGNIACFSFGPGKDFSAGEGGAIATNDEKIYEKLLMLCQHPFRQIRSGLSENPFSLKCHINPLGAAFLLDQWENFERILSVKQTAMRNINEILRQDDNKLLYPVYVREGCLHTCHRFAPRARIRGEKALEILFAKGIPASLGPLQKPIPHIVKQKLKKCFWYPFKEELNQMLPQNRYPVAEKLCNHLITLDWQIGLDESKLNLLSDILKEL